MDVPVPGPCRIVPTERSLSPHFQTTRWSLIRADRMRKRFGVLLRGEVLKTLERSEDVEDEIRYLLRILSER